MMARVELSDVLNFYEYEKVRAERRRHVIELKEARRVSVGPHLSFVFENRDTVLFQIQEMCRVERITDEAKIQDELDVYNALLPGPGGDPAGARPLHGHRRRIARVVPGRQRAACRGRVRGRALR